MNNAREDGGPAFPGQWWDRDSIGETVCRETWAGISMRDYFAAAALTGLCAACDLSGDWTGAQARAAKEAYRLADAMLAARK